MCRVVKICGNYTEDEFTNYENELDVFFLSRFFPQINISYREIISEQRSRGDRNVGGNSNILWKMFTPKIGEDEPNLTNRFFRWVENHQLPLDPKTMKT